MEKLSVPRVLIAGSGAGVGKSLLTVGILYQLRKRNLSVSCCINGPRLAQASLLRRVCGRFVRCLDSRLMSAGQNLASLHQAGVGADIVVIEGQNGLFDGTQPGSLGGSDAEMAALTHTPAVLVIGSPSSGGSAAAIFKGFSVLAGGFKVAQAVLNQVRDVPGGVAAEDDVYRSSFESFGLSAPLGMVPQIKLDAVIPANEISQKSNVVLLPRQFLVDVEDLISRHVDIDQIVELAASAPQVEIEEYSNVPHNRRSRIAVSDDSCFNLCFQDNLDLLRYFGAEIVPFSPLADSALPYDVGGLYLTGACLTEYGAELSRNVSIKNAILDFAQGGGVLYSEGGGTAFLCRDYKWAAGEPALPGIGLIPASAVAANGGVSLNEAVTIEESVLGRAGLILKSVGSGEWKLTKEDRLMKTLRISRGGSQFVFEGYSPGAQSFCSFDFAHFGSNPAVARNLVDAAQVVRRI